MCNRNDFVIKNGVLTNYNGTGGNVILPDGVIEIAGRVFWGRVLTSVEIPAGVTAINSTVFEGNTSLTQFRVAPENPSYSADGPFLYNKERTILVCAPSVSGNIAVLNSVKEIGYAAFSCCHRLTNLIIPDCVTKIGAYAFHSCTNLQEMVIPSSVTRIESSTFLGCTSLTQVVLPDSVVEIEERAFSKCTSLTDVAIPQSVKEFDLGAFDGVKKIKNIAVWLLGGGKLKYWGGVDSLPWLQKDFTAAVAVYLTQTGKRVLTLVEKIVYVNPNETVTVMTELLSAQKVKPSFYKKAAEFALSCNADLDNKPLLALYEAAKAAKAKQAVILLEEAAKQAASGERTVVSVLQKATGHPMETLCLEQFPITDVTRVLNKCGITEKDIPQVFYKDGGAEVPAFVVMCALYPYLEMNDREIVYDAQADKIAAALDTESFQKGLEQLYQVCDNAVGITKKDARCFLIPYCRFCSEQQIKVIIGNIERWNDWYRYNKVGRDTVDLVESAICLNESIEVLLWAATYKNRYGWKNRLEFAAKIRHTTAETLRDTVLAGFCFEDNGER